jgi:pimeloyl-ACP methyl ester carboxylesterase
MSKQNKASIVFAHGIWADGSSFGKLIPALLAEDHEVIAAQYGLDTLAGDVTAVKSALGRVSRPAILVGHSYGGTLITAAGTIPVLRGLFISLPWRPTQTRPHRASRASSRSRMFFPMLKSRTGACGCGLKASNALLVTYPNKSRNSFGQPTLRRLQICLIRRPKGLPGGRSPAGTSWPPRTVPCTPIWNAL